MLLRFVVGYVCDLWVFVSMFVICECLLWYVWGLWGCYHHLRNGNAQEAELPQFQKALRSRALLSSYIFSPLHLFLLPWSMAGFGTTPSNTFFERGMEQQYRKTGQLDEAGQPVLFDIAWEVSDQRVTRTCYTPTNLSIGSTQSWRHLHSAQVQSTSHSGGVWV